MSFDNAHANRKDWRRPYYGSGRFDRTCRPHGSCPYCRRNQTHQDHKARREAELEMKGDRSDGEEKS